MTDLAKIKKDLESINIVTSVGTCNRSSWAIQREEEPCLEIEVGNDSIVLMFDKEEKLQCLSISNKEGVCRWLNIQANPNYLTDDELNEYEEDQQ